MSRPLELSIKKVIVKKKYYPRSRIKKSRIEQFRESMRDGEHIPPIFVGNDGDQYVVIEGAHRLAAAKLEGAKTILAEFWHEKDKDMWLADASRLNDKTRDPMSKKDLYEVVRRLWLGGIRDTYEIAKRMDRSLKFVQRALKPIRDRERRLRNEKIFTLHDQGLNQEEIAKRVGLSRRAVGKILAKRATELNDTMSFGSVVDITSSPKNHPQQGTTQEQEQAQQQVAISSGSGEDCASATPDVDSTPKSSKPAEIIQFPSTNRNKERQEDATEPATTSSDTDKTPDQTDPINNNDYDPLDPEDNAALEMCCFLCIDDPKAYQAIRALELVKQLRWDFLRISEFLGEPVEFLRQVVVFALAVVTSTGDPDPVKHLALKLLDLPFDVIDGVRNALSAHAMLAPAGEELLPWIEENLSESDLELAAQIASATGKEIIADDIRYIVIGKTPPRQRANYCTELTEEQRTTIKEEMHQTTICFRKYRDLLNSGMFRGQALQEVIKYYNPSKTASNEVDEAILNCRKRGYL